MPSQIKQGGYIIVSSLILGLSLHTAAAVFSCVSGGSKTYTSEPASNCTGEELPKISSHQGGAYRLKINRLGSGSEEKSVKPKKTRSKENAREKTDSRKAKNSGQKTRTEQYIKNRKTSSENE